MIHNIQHRSNGGVSLTSMPTFIKIYGHGFYGAHGMPLYTFSFGEQHMNPQSLVVYTNFPLTCVTYVEYIGWVLFGLRRDILTLARDIPKPEECK